MALPLHGLKFFDFNVGAIFASNVDANLVTDGVLVVDV